MVQASPLKRALYYPALQKLTYFVSDRAQATVYHLTEAQARGIIRDIATGHREIVQILEIVPNSKI